MKIMLTHKIRIYPNKTLQKYFTACFGYSRYCYNVALNLWNTMYNDYKKDNTKDKPTGRTVRDIYKRSYKQDWEKLYTPNILDTAFIDVEKAYKNFFAGRSKYPKFKSKRNTKNSFTINRKNDSTIRIINNKLYLPKFPYGITISEQPRFTGNIKICTIVQEANKYYACLVIELDSKYLQQTTSKFIVGIDMSNKKKYIMPIKKIKKLEQNLKYYQQCLSKKRIKNQLWKESKKYLVLKTKIQNIYKYIHNIKIDFLQKITTQIIRKYKYICIEDLAVKNMLKNHKLAKSISESMFRIFRSIITYKCSLYGSILIIADKFYPSTQKCSNCGYTKSNKTKDKM